MEFRHYHNDNPNFMINNVYYNDSRLESVDAFHIPFTITQGKFAGNGGIAIGVARLSDADTILITIGATFCDAPNSFRHAIADVCTFINQWDDAWNNKRAIANLVLDYMESAFTSAAFEYSKVYPNLYREWYKDNLEPAWEW